MYLTFTSYSYIWDGIHDITSVSTEVAHPAQFLVLSPIPRFLMCCP